MLAEPKTLTITTFRNHYYCEACDHSWSDEWCATCDDDCPICGTSISPEESDELDTQEVIAGRDSCFVCGCAHEF